MPLLMTRDQKTMIKFLLLLALVVHSALAQNHAKAPHKKPWQTLHGDQPLVIAKGGFSGLFPESSEIANKVALDNSLPEVVLYCNLQLSKDGKGFCLSDIRLQNNTNVKYIDDFKKKEKTYNIYGRKIEGWFSIDFTSDELQSLYLAQSIASRNSLFDGQLPVATVEDVIGLRPPQLWLNVENDMFLNQNKLSPALFIKNLPHVRGINYISSPEIDFLKAVNGKVGKRTKFIFRFPESEDDKMEPTANNTYESLLKNLASIKPFASGILVPKKYIWPVKDMYLEEPTTLVADAHREGLEVYAYGFANDIFASYNYSYDPEAEYLQFVGNSKFSVDGVLTDFSPTASAAIGCLAHNKKKKNTGENNFLVISHNGASGIYPASTDMAYNQAVTDGADVIDCSVQMTKDGVAFCLSSPNLMIGTTVMTTPFMARVSTVPRLSDKNGIYSFDLTWSEIQTLKPQISTSLPESLALTRNPQNKNKGKFWTLQDFLNFAKQQNVSGILINIQNAAYLASEKSLSITDEVARALSNATLDKQSTQQVFIQSDDSSVLSKFKDAPAYKKVLNILKEVGDAPRNSVEEIKKFADAVSITRASVLLNNIEFFTTANTSTIGEMHAANISIYVGVMRNEFTSIPQDLFSDPMVEIATYKQLGADGVITEYPGTATAYTRTPCSDENNEEYFVRAAVPGALLNAVPQELLVPAAAPLPPLDASDIVDPPLPAPRNGITSQSAAPAPSATHSSSASARVINLGLSVVAIAVFCILSL